MFKKLMQRMFTNKPPEKAKSLGRNELCWCGSGMKYKQCHYMSDQEYFQKEFASACKESAA